LSDKKEEKNMNWLTTNGGRRAGSDFVDLHRGMDRLLEDVFSGFGRPTGLSLTNLQDAFAPDMDIVETEKAYELTAELPGMAEQDVDVELADGVLTIAGEKKSEHEENRKGVYRVERSYGKFQRRFALPADVEADKVEARVKDGVLRLVLPKAETAGSKVKKIQVRRS
jgi:HSP20 family protein